jgi:hypothetical protein
MSFPGRFGCWWWLWAVAYAALVSAILGSMFAARRWSLAELATPSSIAQWEAWREDVRTQQNQPSPVERRVPKSGEPPALVMMRDYFGVSLCGAILFSSLLYWIIAWLVSGTLARPTPAMSHVDESLRDSPTASRRDAATSDRPAS